jgi:site-specific DNA-methyltransferase (adenine-specific)
MLKAGMIHNTDCMTGMREFPDKYFDLAVCDPPYGIGADSMNFATSGAKTIGKAIRRDYRRAGATWDVAPGAEYFVELMRVSKNQIIWGGNYFSGHLPPSRGFICWDKRSSEAMSNDFADCEIAWMSPGLGVARMFRFLWNGMLQGDMRFKEDRIHPTQKPAALYRWIYSKYLIGGGSVLDTHAGSGSSLVAAYDLRVEYVGFEIDPEYCRAAMQRYANHTAQIRMEV